MDAFALIEAMLDRPARPHILSSLDVFDIARQALVETPSYDEHMRLEEQFQSADGCFTAFQIRDDAVRGSTGIRGVSFMLTDAECMSEVRLREGMKAVIKKLVDRLLREREAAYV